MRLPPLAGSLALLALSPGPSWAQCPEWSAEFFVPGVPARHTSASTAAAADPYVDALQVFDDGSGPALYVAGLWFFPDAGGQTPLAQSIARWDGDALAAVGAGLDSVAPGVHRVSALEVFDDGGGPALYAATSDGDVFVWDGTAWATEPGTLDEIRDLHVFDDGGGPALYAAGDWTSQSGVSNVMRRFPAGGWAPVGGAMNFTVFALAEYDDGNGPRLYAGGAFTSIGGQAIARLAVWDGAQWQPAGGADSTVYDLAVFDDGSGPKLYAGGLFSSIGGVAASKAARFDGATWSAVGTALGGTGAVRALEPYDAGSGTELYASGDFTVTDGGSTSSMARLDAVAGEWRRVGGGVQGSVNALAAFDDGGGARLFAGGTFRAAGGRVANRLSSWDGASWSLGDRAGNGLDDFAHALAVHDDGSGPALYVGGDFDWAGDVRVNRVARWDGASWSPLGAGITGTAAQRAVYALAVFDDGGGPDLYVGGRFTTAGGVPVHNLARWDGAGWSDLGGGLPIGTVHALAVWDDGSGPALYATGDFLEAGGTPVVDVARWDGSSWSALGSGLGPGTGRALTVANGGAGTPSLFVGGSFSTAGGVATGGVAEWDGASWHALAGFPQSTLVRALAVLDGDLHVANVGTSRVTRWTNPGSVPLGTGMDGLVLALAPLDSGAGTDLFAGGDFATADGKPAPRVARWDGAGWHALDGGLNGTVTALAVFDAGDGPELYAAGELTHSADEVTQYLARWRTASCCDEPLAYCTGKTNSLGCVPYVTTVGSPSASDTGAFQVRGEDVIDGSFGFLLYGFQKANLAFHGGRLCLKAPERLLPPKLAKAEGVPPCRGVLRRNFNAHVQGGGDPALTVGATVFAQWFQRDPQDPAGFGDSLTDAVRFRICP